MPQVLNCNRDRLSIQSGRLDQRMQILLVHGICHLLGYDHERDEDYKVMKRKEDFLLKKLQKG